jgi:hypothetical protein
VGIGATGKGRWWGKGIGGGIWCENCVYTYVNVNMIPVKTIPGMGGVERMN